mmetsp:Transcript_18408/g.20464  ORF Transcript_18408/g.20464 Transcript_18408/m.20464 type:complete len:324 (-) Transcript_18408:2-973(-)
MDTKNNGNGYFNWLYNMLVAPFTSISGFIRYLTTGILYAQNSRILAKPGKPLAETLPSEIQEYICSFSPDAFTKWHTLSKKTATATHYDKNMQQRGKWLRWHKGGAHVQREYIRLPNGHQSVRGWYSNGALELKYIKVSSTTAHGKLEKWHKNGQLQIEEYYNYGVPTGTSTEFYDNGKKKTEKSFDSNGKEHGLTKHWFENGQLKFTMTISHGAIQGEHKTWYENGQLAQHFYFERNLLNGPCKSWFDNGQEMFVGTYFDGKQHGEYEEWHRNGRVRMVAVHDHGKPLPGYRVFNEYGQQIPNYKLLDEKLNNGEVAPTSPF